MEPKLTQTQTQKLILAPQLRQFLKLLELPIFELDQKIDQELEANPTLEEVPPSPGEELPSETETDLESLKNEENSPETRDILAKMDAIDRIRKYDNFSHDFSDNELGEI